jgi:hypothetical protein
MEYAPTRLQRPSIESLNRYLAGVYCRGHTHVSERALMRRTLIAVTLLLGAACGSPTSPGSGLTVLARGGSLQLENQSDRRTFYFIYEGEASALINWAQCVDLAPSVCPSLAPGERTVVPYSAIGGYEPGKTEAVVWSWEAVLGSGWHSIPSPVHATLVRL